MFRVISSEKNGLEQILLNNVPYSSYSYDYRGVKKIISWYKKIFGTEKFLYLIEISVQNVIISIPTFYKLHPELSSGRKFDELWKSEFEVIVKNPEIEVPAEQVL